MTALELQYPLPKITDNENDNVDMEIVCKKIGILTFQ
jgi:hypothetical protein